MNLIVFDVDGTLIDSQQVIVAAMDAAFAALGAPSPPREAVLGIVGLSLVEAMTALAPERPEEEIRLLADNYRESFVASRAAATGTEGFPLYPGAAAAIGRLATRDDTLLGIATGKARVGLDHVLDAHGLAHAFVTKQTADRHPSKPHPSMLLAALAETGVAPHAAAMVGDTEFDMAMGRAAGMATVGVAWGYHPRARLEAAGADIVIDGYDGLDAALARLGLLPA